MSNNLVKQFSSLELLCKVQNPKARNSILKELCKDHCFCRAVREVAKNTVNGNIKLSDSHKRKLRKHKKLLVDIAKKRKDKRRTKKLVQQTGSGFILPILVPLVATILGDILKK